MKKYKKTLSVTYIFTNIVLFYVRKIPIKRFSSVWNRRKYKNMSSHFYFELNKIHVIYFHVDFGSTDSFLSLKIRICLFKSNWLCVCWYV